MDLGNLTDLEFYFADHFDTVLFPLLAERYLQQNDFVRAHKVCEIGLQNHPHSVEGLFIEARTFLAENQLPKAEKLLKHIIKLSPDHYNAHVLLAAVQTELHRAEATLRKLYSRILQMDSGNEEASAWLSEWKEKKKGEPVTTASTKKTGRSGIKKPSEKASLASLRISPQIATFTLMAILKDQKLYDRALEVLAVMEKKPKANENRIKKEREDLMRLVKEQAGRD